MGGVPGTTYFPLARDLDLDNHDVLNVGSISGVDLDLSGSLTVDTIDEHTGAAGVTVEGVLHRDNHIIMGEDKHVGIAASDYFSFSEGNSTITASTSFLDCTGVLKADTIGEHTGAAGVTVDGVLLKDNGIDLSGAITVDTINEHTGAAGVTVDGVLVKDNGIDASGTITVDTIDEHTGAAGVTIEGVAFEDSNITMPEDAWIGTGAALERIAFDGTGGLVKVLAANLDCSGSIVVGGEVNLSDGGPLGPALKFTIDPDTGLYSAGANIIGFATNGALQASIVDGGMGIGTTTVPHGAVGVAKFAIDGTNGSTAGPHIQITTDSDDYPLFQALMYSHDNLGLIFDAYWDTLWKSSDAGSNFAIYKLSDVLLFRTNAGTAAGAQIVAWTESFRVLATGHARVAVANQWQFRDDAIHAASLDDGHLDLTADVSVDVNTPRTYVSGTLGIGTETVSHGGVGYAMLALEGADANAAGPHVQITTASNDYPLFQMFMWSHDNMALAFDTYYDGAWKSSDAGSNFIIYKLSDTLQFLYNSGTAAGAATGAWDQSFAITAATGHVLVEGTHQWQFRDPDVNISSPADSIGALQADGYWRVGAGTTSQGLGANGDFLVSGHLEVNGQADFEGKVYFRETSDGSLTYWMRNAIVYLSTAVFQDDGTHLCMQGVDNDDNFNLILTSYDNRARDHDHDTLSADPTFFVHSATSVDSDNTQWWSIAHDRTDAIYNLGTGLHKFTTGHVRIDSTNAIQWNAATEAISSKAAGMLDYDAATEHHFDSGDVHIDASLGVGSATVANQRLRVVATYSADPGGNSYGMVFAGTSAYTAAANRINYSYWSRVIWSGDANGKTITNYGMYSVASARTACSSVYGSFLDTYAEYAGAGTIAFLIGHYSRVRCTHADKTVTSGYAFWANSTVSAGSMGTAYLYYGASDGNATTNWGVYITGEDKNYFSGDVGIGDATPSYKLDVNGTGRFVGNLNADAGLDIIGTATIATNDQFQFRDPQVHIASLDDGHLDLTADVSIDLNGNVELLGGQVVDQVTKAAAYTTTAGDYVILCDTDTAGAGFTITLPAAASHAGRVYYVKNTGTGHFDVTVDGNGAETIDGAATQTVIDGNCLAIVCDGTEWWVI